MGNKTKALRVEGIIKLIVEHEGSELTFTYPFLGDPREDSYVNLAKKIDRKGLGQPTIAQIASLIYASFQENGVYDYKIRQIMESTEGLLGFTGNLYIPNEGIYIQDNPRIVNGNISMNKKDLVGKLDANDPNVRFVPFGFRIGHSSALELTKNPYVIGLVGEEGADKLSQIADMYKGINGNPNKKAYIFSFENVDNEIVKVSALGSPFIDFGLFSKGACVLGIYGGSNYKYTKSYYGENAGVAFGLLDKINENGK